jgi:hypothetical protein
MTVRMRLRSFRRLANLTALVNNDACAKRMARSVLDLTCSIRYYRPGRHEDAGLLIAKKTERAAYKARLEASGYVVLDEPPTLPEIIEKSS